jgi:DNA-binding transcriptional ArsR family regulator
MFHRAISCDESVARHRADLMALLAERCSRPRYAFLMLSLLADIARADGSAGPLVARGSSLIPLRDWLCEALSPLADKDTRRQALASRAEQDLKARGAWPQDAALAARTLEEEVKLRVLASGKTNVSRTVSELVRAGLLDRHYQGYWVDHENRGAQRQAVYTLAGTARLLLRTPAPRPAPDRPNQLQLL